MISWENLQKGRDVELLCLPTVVVHLQPTIEGSFITTVCMYRIVLIRMMS